MDLKELRKKVKEEEAKIETVNIDVADTGDTSDTLQNTVNRLTAAIDKVDDKIVIKDLTHLTTQDEVVDAVVRNGIYKMPSIINTWTSYNPLMVCLTKTSTEAKFNGIANYLGTIYTLETTFTKGATGNTSPTYVPIYIGEPTDIHHAATKKYVDNKLSETITLTFDDGTTEDIKVGK